ncbi:S8 family serine peptidase [Actinomadura sp. KC06]|uniref:S8 family serine peptidase n=1 Tax=Actinomadura sp. KC06 TaxID=2530369 RepID=UPI001A9E3DA6|nr:S8 family serine peptidase [Actinomadura sp. KC06]
MSPHRPGDRANASTHRLAARATASPHRFAARATAALSVLALGAAVAVPVATAPGGLAAQRTVRGASATAPMGAAADQIRSREWHLEVLRATKAWKYSKGRGVTVAVLDTGVDQRHPDLTGQVVNGPDLTGGVRRPGTRYWGLHGTSMASIISGHGHGAGLSQGMMGVAPQSRVLSVRVTLENDDPLRRDGEQQAGGAERDAVAQGIRYAVDHGANIINMSLGGGRQFYDGTASQESAIKYALGKGVILIASAGNDGSGANRKNFPAAYPGVIAVGALDRKLRLWKDSNRRSNATICAPGVDIVSADARNGYVVGTGTSASSAMVAGVAALVRSRYPRLSPAEVRQALIQGSPARPGHPTGSPTCRGTVDALRTLIAAHAINKTSSGPVESPPASPSPEPAAESSGEGTGLLLPLVLGGGGLLVVLGLVLGWRQRRRPDDDGPDTDAVPDYGLPSAPPVPREPAAVVPYGAPSFASTAGESAEIAADIAPEIAPVSVPLWQSTEVHPRPSIPDIPPADPSPFDAPSPAHIDASPPAPVPVDAPPSDPVDGSWDLLSWDTEASSWDTEASPWDAESWDSDSPSDLGPPPPEPPSKEPPILSSELRPFDPGEFFANGLNGHTANGHNGEHLNGTNGSFRRDDPLSDDDWEAFRRSSLDSPEPSDGSFTAPLSAVPPEDSPVRPGDEESTGAFPALPSDEEPAPGPVQPTDPADWPADWQADEPRGRHSRRSPSSDDEEYRPPWW